MIGEPNSSLRQPIQRGRVHELVTVASQIAPTKIIGDDEQDIGLCRVSGMQPGGRGNQQSNQEKEGGFQSVDLGFSFTCLKSITCAPGMVSGSIVSLAGPFGSLRVPAFRMLHSRLRYLADPASSR